MLEHPDNLDLIIKRATVKQTVIFTEDTTPSGITTTDGLELFLKQHSQSYPSIIQADFLAKGGEAIVYRIEHTGLDEIVVKTPLFSDDGNTDKLIEQYDSIFYESQLLKLNPHSTRTRVLSPGT